MNIASVPELTLLTEFLPDTEPMGRALFFHYPSNTVAEILPSDVDTFAYDGPKRAFQATTIEGELMDLIIYIHRTVAEDIEQVFDAIVEGHHRFTEWTKDDGGLDDYLDSID